MANVIRLPGAGRLPLPRTDAGKMVGKPRTAIPAADFRKERQDVVLRDSFIRFAFLVGSRLRVVPLPSSTTNAAEALWKKHAVHQGAQSQTAIAGDFTKDGRPDIIANSGEKTRHFVARWPRDPWLAGKGNS
jgi:hypothetical protein